MNLSQYPLLFFVSVALSQTTAVAQTPSIWMGDDHGQVTTGGESEESQFDLNAPSEESIQSDKNAQTLKAGEWFSIKAKAIEGITEWPTKPAMDLSKELLAPVIEGGDDVPAEMWVAAYYVHSYAVARSLGLNRTQARTIKFLSNPRYIYTFKKTVNPKSVEDLNLATAFSWVRSSGCASHAEMAKVLNADKQPPREAVERSAYNTGAEVRQFFDNRTRKDPVVMDHLHRVMTGSGLPIGLSIKTPPDWGKTPVQWDSYLAEKGGIYRLDPKVSPADLERQKTTAVTLVGYNSQTKASKVVGSWGRGWGNDGFLWIDDASLQRMTRRAMTLDLGTYKARQKRNERLIAAGEMAPPQDYALVVGVNGYKTLGRSMPGLRPLKGCENDANAVAASFKEMGWNVALLSGENATRNKIFLALNQIKSKIGAQGRFVFYFAGHGSRDAGGNPVILPVDALPDSDKNDLSPEALEQAIGPMQAASKNVLIDSCFSGGFAGQNGPELRPNPIRLASARGRFVWRLTLRTTQARTDGDSPLRLVSSDGARRGQLQQAQFSPVAFQEPFNPPANGSDLPSFSARSDDGDSATPICFLVASQSNQIAQEWPQLNVIHGGFTRNLLRYISGQGRTWGAVYTSISKNLEGSTSPQHPCLTPGFYETGMFQTWQSPPSGSQGRADVGTIPDPRVVQLLLMPNQTRFQVGDKINFNVQVSKAGYVVLLSKGTSGKTSLLYPPSKEFIQKIQAGQSLAEGEAYFQAAAPAGKEGYELFWFNDASAVETLFDVMEKAQIPKTKSEDEDGQDSVYCAPLAQFDSSFKSFLSKIRQDGYKPKVISSKVTIDIVAP